MKVYVLISVETPSDNYDAALMALDECTFIVKDESGTTHDTCVCEYYDEYPE